MQLVRPRWEKKFVEEEEGEQGEGEEEGEEEGRRLHLYAGQEALSLAKKYLSFTVAI